VEAAVEAHDLTRTYGATVAVDGLSFAARPGSVLGVLGPNGAGKTTAIRVLTTILRPSAGRFTVAGVPGTDAESVRARIGVLPESAGYPAMETGREYVAYHARLHGRSRADATAAAGRLLAEVGLADRAGSLIGTYSRGMRQRLGIARALVNDPAVVFLDEPTLGLDPPGQRHVLDLVRRMSEERGATVLLSSHLLAEVEQVCSDVLILNRGRLVAFGPIEEVARRAAAPRSARLRVPAVRGADAVAALEGLPEVAAVGPPPGERPGVLAVRLSVAAEADAAGGAILRALLEADVPVAEFAMEGGRLSDAFLEMVSA
jgi:ABC-2 type transport system ATP-binding protein